jgi:ribosome biogenesis GTPase / thiamine phosphate phosphatase
LAMVFALAGDSTMTRGFAMFWVSLGDEGACCQGALPSNVLNGSEGTVRSIEPVVDVRLGWTEELTAAWRALRTDVPPGRVVRLDRGWSSVSHEVGDDPLRVRNIGADVAVGDWVVPSVDDERIEHVLPRRSAFVRRASFEGSRAESHTLAANIDVILLVHGLTGGVSQRRLERELVLAFDSGATPVLVLTKRDLVDQPTADAVRTELAAVAPGVDIMAASGISGDGVEALRALAEGGLTLALLGASGVGKSTLVNALIGHQRQQTAEVREGDQRGRHTTVAAELVHLPGGGWLVDTPGLRAVSLWNSIRGIELAFSDVFDLMDHCRFRDCKHDDEPGCAVQAAVANGALDPARLDSLKKLVAEEASVEDEQRAREKATDRRGYRRPRPVKPPR